MSETRFAEVGEKLALATHNFRVDAKVRRSVKQE